MNQDDLKMLNDLCSWLMHQKGMMPQGYAKDLAKILVKLNKDQK